MLAIKKTFEAITNLKKENLSFDDYLHLKEVVKALCRLKTVDCKGVVFTHRGNVAQWFMRRLKTTALDVTPCGDTVSTWVIQWRQ